jgi:hypothetical protein
VPGRSRIRCGEGKCEDWFCQDPIAGPQEDPFLWLFPFLCNESEYNLFSRKHQEKEDGKSKKKQASKPKVGGCWWLMSVNPSYSEGRDQEDHSSKPDRANSSRDPILKIPNTKKCGRNGSRCKP